MKVKKRYYFLKVLFWHCQFSSNLMHHFEIPFTFTYLKDCEVFAEKLNELLQEANDETDHWYCVDVNIEEEEVKEKEEAKTKAKNP